MKRFFAAVVLLFLACASRGALVSSNLLTFQTVTSTLASPYATNSAVVNIGSIYLPVATVTIQHGGVTNVAMLPIDLLCGLSTNPASQTVLQTFYPAATNDGIETVTFTNTGLVQVYFSLSIRPTNTCSAGAQVIQQK